MTTTDSDLISARPPRAGQTYTEWAVRVEDQMFVFPGSEDQCRLWATRLRLVGQAAEVVSCTVTAFLRRTEWEAS